MSQKLHKSGPFSCLFLFIFLLSNWYLAHIQIHQFISLVVVHTGSMVAFNILCMKYGNVAMFEIGRWAKNELKQVHSAVDSCSSSYFPASSMIVFQTTASSHTHTSCKTNCSNTTAALHNIWCHDIRVEIGRWSKYQMKLDQTGLNLPSSSYFVKDIMHLTICCW
jgi:hypothetical protein